MNPEAARGQVGYNLPPSEEQRVVKKVAVLGHSYVRDLPIGSRHVLGNYQDNRIALCRKFYLPGATVESIQQGDIWDRFVTYKADFTILIIGGNDITNHSQPAVIARKLVELAKRVREETGGEVKILTIEKRSQPRGLTPLQFNRQRTSINRYLKHRDPFTKERLIFSEATSDDFFDGVHLRERASRQLANVLRWHLENFCNQ